MKRPTKSTSREECIRYYEWRDATLTAAIEGADGFQKRRLQQARSAARRAWRQLLKEQRREAMRRNDTPAAVPAAGWELLVKRQFTSNNKTYPVGCRIAPEILGRNLQAFLNSHFVEFSPPGATKPSARPRTLPPPAPPETPPAVEIVDDPDPVASWRRSLDHMTAKCSGNAARAKDMLLGTREGSARYLLAVRVDTERRAREAGVVSVSPVL